MKEKGITLIALVITILVGFLMVVNMKLMVYM